MRKAEKEKILDKIKELEYLQKEQEPFMSYSKLEMGIWAVFVPILLYIYNIKPVNWKAFFIVIVLAYIPKIGIGLMGGWAMIKYSDYGDEIKKLYAKLNGRKIKKEKETVSNISNPYIKLLLKILRYILIFLGFYLLIQGVDLTSGGDIIRIWGGIVLLLLFLILPNFLIHSEFIVGGKPHLIPDYFAYKQRLSRLAYFLNYLSMKIMSYIDKKGLDYIKKNKSKKRY